ncbi:glutaredoxin [Fusarium beomiforme]|uniref:Glutaredoxin n=1 Tax=Fusarium beomiforme TaxID=44412 RepID=A0A9P5ADS5_9HYPO|nr:glutaredoxin [Fusarium beomiforme]
MSMLTEIAPNLPAAAHPQPLKPCDPGESKEALTARLRDLVNSAPVMLFMKGVPKCPLCRFSRRIVRILNDHGIQYDSFNVLKDEAVRQGIKEFADWPTFPQLWVNGELVGGLDVVSSVDSAQIGYVVADGEGQVKEEFAANPEFLASYSVKAVKEDTI